jgi:hypothetical protein
VSEDRTCTVDGCSEEAYIWLRDGRRCRVHYEQEYAAQKAEFQRLTTEAGGPWPQRCPRRDEMFQRGGVGDLDLWEIREQLANGIVARHCNYCGSLHSDDFMRMIEEGATVVGTDKNYKAYLRSPAGPETKFYYAHLSAEQRDRFITLYNEKRMKLGESGLYRLPFFAGRA